MHARYRINQLSCDANLVRRLVHRPFEDVAHAERTPDLLDIGGSALEREARIASDDEQRFELRERGDDLLNHPVGKILLLGLAAYVLEREHGDGGLVG